MSEPRISTAAELAAERRAKELHVVQLKAANHRRGPRSVELDADGGMKISGEPSAAELALGAATMLRSVAETIGSRDRGAVGATGPQGDPGQTGPQGDRGEAGADGSDGHDAVVALDQLLVPIAGPTVERVATDAEGRSYRGTAPVARDDEGFASWWIVRTSRDAFGQLVREVATSPTGLVSWVDREAFLYARSEVQTQFIRLTSHPMCTQEDVAAWLVQLAEVGPLGTVPIPALLAGEQVSAAGNAFVRQAVKRAKGTAAS